MLRRFRQVDVFSTEPYRGNPVAVVLDGDGLDTTEMQRFANWTNLSETTFVLAPTAAGADYQVRIFTPVAELPFAGHPTLGTCHAWLEADPARASATTVVQQCAAGLVAVRRVDGRLAFAAPPLRRSGPVDDATVGRVAALLGIERAAIRDAQWADNGPGWVAVLLDRVEEVLAVRPAPVDFDIGVVAVHPAGAEVAVEVRAFFPKDGATVEDPVTGSLNAAIAPWLIATGRAAPSYVAAQGTALGRTGRVHISTDDEGAIWGGGATTTGVRGAVEI
jgi:PhzF family phenazine biosynthesis protein